MPSASFNATATTPPRSSRHRKRDSDPLADLPDNAIELSDRGQNEEAGSEGILSRIILGPLAMISFVLSLCIVNSQHRAWRVAQHNHEEGSWLKKLSPWTWLNAEPYQSPSDSTWQHAVQGTSTSEGIDGSTPAPAVDTERWYMRKKHRKIAKLQFSDALEMRGIVALALVVGPLLGLLTAIWFLRHLYLASG